jgi:hypothetical protein
VPHANAKLKLLSCYLTPSNPALAANCLDKLARFFRNSPAMKTSIPPVLITFALVCFAVIQNTQAVSPAPDGGYSGGNTAEEQNSLLSLTSGMYNTGIGIYSLLSLTDGNF